MKTSLQVQTGGEPFLFFSQDNSDFQFFKGRQHACTRIVQSVHLRDLKAASKCFLPKIGDISLLILVYADDQLLIDITFVGLQKKLKFVANYFTQNGLLINLSKT